jgi:tetrahydromethanopterin S-methyltransferase subunit G
MEEILCRLDLFDKEVEARLGKIYERVRKRKKSRDISS